MFKNKITQIFGLVSLFIVDHAFAGIPRAGKNSFTTTAISGNLDASLTTSTDIYSSILNYLNMILYFTAPIAMSALIYGGFLYLTDFGGDENSKKAKKIIEYSIIGIVIIFLSYSGTSTLIDRLGRVNLITEQDFQFGQEGGQTGCLSDVNCPGNLTCSKQNAAWMDVPGFGKVQFGTCKPR